MSDPDHTPNNVTTPSQPAAVQTPGKFRAFLHRAADTVEGWMIDSGALEQLAFLVTKTGLVRHLTFAAATSLFGMGITQGSVAEMLMGSLVTVIIGTVNAFVTRMRNKYAGQLQAIVGVRQDHFIGPVTIAQVADVAAYAAQASDTVAAIKEAGNATEILRLKPTDS